MSGWNSERIEKLKAMWAEGQSGGRIADVLGGVTRSAVIGKVHRLKLPKRKPAGPKRASPAPARKLTLVRDDALERRRLEARMKTKAAIADMAKGGPDPMMVKLDELEPHHCRWPIGDPVDDKDTFGFCGHRKAWGSSYCESHKARATSKIPPERRGRPMRRVA